MSEARKSHGAQACALRSELRVGLAAAEALGLFTPVGERLWVEGWNLVFPAGEVGDGASVGTVFITDHGGRETTWIVVDRDEVRVRYARITPDWWAGLVEECDVMTTRRARPVSL